MILKLFTQALIFCHKPLDEIYILYSAEPQVAQVALRQATQH